MLNKSISKLFMNIRKHVAVQIKFSTVTIDHIVNFKTNFTHEEESKILNILNHSDAEQLSRFRVSQTRIKNIETWRIKRGPFKSLNEVLEVDGLGENVLEKLCETIIKNNIIDTTANKGANKRIKNLITPLIPKGKLQRLNTAVGIHLTPTGVSWAKLSRNDCKLSEWGLKHFNSLPKKMLQIDTLNLAIKIIKNLPESDAYIFESNANLSPQAQKQPSVVVSYVQQLELVSMLVALLNTINKSHAFENDNYVLEDEVDNKVFFLRSKIPARLFQTLVGNERVSAISKVTKLIEVDEGPKDFSLPCRAICIEPRVTDIFMGQAPPGKELLGQALLLVVSFMNLCVYKNDVSFEALVLK